jgi:multidrug resistance efflux pump
VARIDQQGTEHHGDVTYPVTIELDQAAPDWLRWGMTAQIEIETAPGSSTSPAPASAEAAGDGPEIAEAVIEPERWSEVSFPINGEVAEVRVAAGEHVAEGEVLVQLNATNAALTVRDAEAALATAQARLALKRAGPRAEEIAAAEADVEAAQGNLRRATALRDQLKSGAAAELASIRAQLEAAEAERRQARAEIDWADEAKDEERARTAQERFHAANLRIAAAEARLAAQPRAAAAQLCGADARVRAAQAQVGAAQARLDLLKAGPMAEEIAMAEADVQQAQVELAATRVALERTTLRAPFAGTVTQVHVETGDAVAPGQAVLVLAGLDRLQVKTTDLTELDVVHVTEGESAVVTVDALPGETFAGVVREIALQPGEYRGDVVYAVAVDLADGTDPRLRWGMTAVVKIEVQ